MVPPLIVSFHVFPCVLAVPWRVIVTCTVCLESLSYAVPVVVIWRSFVMVLGRWCLLAYVDVARVNDDVITIRVRKISSSFLCLTLFFTFFIGILFFVFMLSEFKLFMCDLDSESVFLFLVS